MDELEVAGQRFTARRAGHADVPAIVALLRDDAIAAGRESAELAPYEAAFEEVDADPHQLLAVVCAADGTVVGTLQLTLVPGLSRGGTKRLLVEGVRLAPGARGAGLGTAVMAWAHDVGRREGATLAQLTSDKSRADAHRFYERLGYAATHEGFKLPLE